jgi:hypothetical protein
LTSFHKYFIKTSSYHGVVLFIYYFIIEIKQEKFAAVYESMSIFFVYPSNIILQYASRTSVKLKQLLVRSDKCIETLTCPIAKWTGYGESGKH